MTAAGPTTLLRPEDQVPEREVLAEQVRLVYRMVSTAPWTMLGISVLVTVVLHDIGPPIYLWLAVQVALKVGAYVEYRWLFPMKLIAERPEALMYRLMIGQAPHAMGWAALTLASGHGSDFQQLFSVMILVGVLAAGVTTFGGLPRIHIAYIAGYLVMEAANFLLLHDVVARQSVTFYSILLTSIFSVGLFTNTRITGRTYRDSILLGFANTRLARRLEQEVLSTRAAQRTAEAANAAKSKFLAAASHDLRQPIHALGMFLAVLDRSRLNLQQRKTLGLARSALTASFEMLDTLLDFSRAEAGVIVPRIQAFHLTEVLRQIEEEIAVTADAKKLVYRTREVDAVVSSDPTIVKLILLNLASNAIRYTATGGLLIGCRRRGERIVLEVWDTGIGIPSGNWEEVFSDFTQLGNSERDRRKGLGLGLAIARRLARLIGSEITLNSWVGRGSVFRFSLPLSEIDPQPGSAPTPRPEPSRTAGVSSGHILIVDDDVAIRVSLSALLQDVGYSADAVETIAEAEESAGRRAPDLLICDFRLRDGESGAEASRRLRAQLGRRTPAILVTGDTHPERVAEAAREDMEILYKPAQPDLLLDLVARLLEQQ